MTKKALVLVLTLSMMLSLAGCGSENQEQVPANVDQQVEETNDGPVELTLWGASEDNALLKKMVENFEKEYEGQAQFQISVEAVEEADCQDAVLENMADAADVFIFRDKQLAPLVAAGALSPVQVPDAVERESSEYAFAAASFNDELYAYPMATTSGYVLFYNKEFVTAQEAGTIDSILYKVETLGKKFAMDWSSADILYHFFGCADMYLRVSEDGRSNEANLNTSVGVNHGKEVAQGLVDIAYNQYFVSQTVEESMEAAKTDEVVAFIANAELYEDIKAIWGDNCAVGKMPYFQMPNGQLEMGSILEYRMVGVNNYTAHEDWAHTLATYLTSEESQMLRLKENGDRPCNLTAVASTDATSDPIIKAVNAHEKFSITWNALPGYEEAFAGFGQWMIDCDFEPYEDLTDEESGDIIIASEDRVTDMQPYVDMLQDAVLSGSSYPVIEVEDEGESADVQEE